MNYDVVVIGGGHAGCEAAAASARAGAKTALVTHKQSTIGVMSCNPAIGGLGKGHLVREIDALDGLMGRVADAAGIQFRLLNRRKGPAVRGPRTQADRRLYREAMQTEIASVPNLDVIEGDVFDLGFDNGVLTQVVLANGRAIACRAAVLTTGTFLRGLIHIGNEKIPAGRVGEAPSVGLSATLARSGFALGRLKTGTPARLDGKSIDWASIGRQGPDEEPVPFSFMTDRITTPQIDCGVTRTTSETHRIIEENLSQSAMYSGRLPVSDLATALRLKTRSSSSVSATGTRCFWSPRASTMTRSIRMAFRRPCRVTCRRCLSAPFRAWKRLAFSSTATRSNMITSIPGN